jgi:hypothetical protein
MYFSVNTTKDSNGQSLSDVLVNLRNQSSGIVSNGTTNSEGFYDFGLIERYRNNGTVYYWL